eukprot:scaffold6335_cov175-Prasinococcus_capsulatus_cf.AAC.1
MKCSSRSAQGERRAPPSALRRRARERMPAGPACTVPGWVRLAGSFLLVRAAPRRTEPRAGGGGRRAREQQARGCRAPAPGA